MHKSVKALCLGCPTCHFHLYLSQLPREHFRGAPLKVADHSNMLGRSVTAFCLVLNLHTSGVSKGMSSFFPKDSTSSRHSQDSNPQPPNPVGKCLQLYHDSTQKHPKRAICLQSALYWNFFPFTVGNGINIHNSAAPGVSIM